jgi:tRNA A37 threonylcarbamoyladenosine biosynthesis protein TsaE
MVIEWAEKIEPILPQERLWVTIRDISRDQRDMIFTAQGKYYQSLLKIFRRHLYGGL